MTQPDISPKILSVSRGIALLGLLASALLATAKYTGLLAWSWWWVAAPALAFWAVVCVLASLAAVVVVLVLLLSRYPLAR